MPNERAARARRWSGRPLRLGQVIIAFRSRRSTGTQRAICAIPPLPGAHTTSVTRRCVYRPGQGMFAPPDPRIRLSSCVPALPSRFRGRSSRKVIVRNRGGKSNGARKMVECPFPYTDAWRAVASVPPRPGIENPTMVQTRIKPHFQQVPSRRAGRSSSGALPAQPDLWPGDGRGADRSLVALAYQSQVDLSARMVAPVSCDQPLASRLPCCSWDQRGAAKRLFLSNWASGSMARSSVAIRLPSIVEWTSARRSQPQTNGPGCRTTWSMWWNQARRLPPATTAVRHVRRLPGLPDGANSPS